MRSELVIALRMVVVTLVLTGVIYPLAVDRASLNSCFLARPTAAWSRPAAGSWVLS